MIESEESIFLKRLDRAVGCDCRTPGREDKEHRWAARKRREGHEDQERRVSDPWSQT